MIAKYGDKAHMVVEDLGASPIAAKFGVDKYPAVFVDDALVARPEDFFAWGGPATGKYVPWKELPNRRRFQDDLRKMIDIRLGGGELASLPHQTKAAPRSLPNLPLVDLQGKKFTFAQLRGKPVLIEFWATWCPLCLQTMGWMKKLDVNVVNIALESKREDIDAVVAKLQPSGRIVIASPELRDAFDGPPAIPTLLLADANGQIVRVFYGAPATLHAEVEKELAKLASG